MLPKQLKHISEIFWDSWRTHRTLKASSPCGVTEINQNNCIVLGSQTPNTGGVWEAFLQQKWNQLSQGLPSVHESFGLCPGL